MVQSSVPEEDEIKPLLPVEIELYIEPDGTVIFADLAAEALPLARALDPDQIPPHEGGKPPGEGRND